jgi:uncharacterized RDD family membrane protein YckC
MTWYYADAGRQVGPVEESALDDLVRQGVVRDDTLVWKEGMAAWQPHASVRGARAAAPMPADASMIASLGPSMAPSMGPSASAAPAAESRFCSECGRPFPSSELVSIGSATVCATCKPVFMQRMREGGQAIGARHYGGFWIRFLARCIDAVLLAIVGFIISIPLTLVMGGAAIGGFGPNSNPAAAAAAIPAIMGALAIRYLIQLAISVAYEAYFVSTRGGTLGKLALGLKIIRADGSGVPVGLAVGRYFAQILSSLTFLIGYIMAGFDSEKRALHDRICDTRVIYSK